MATVNVDDIWLNIGHFERYQKQQIIWYGISMTGAAYILLVYVFAAYRPSHSCRLPANQSFGFGIYPLDFNRSDVEIVGQSCGITLMTNLTNHSLPVKLTEQSCQNGYKYDIQQETIVTEWDLVCGNEGKGEFTQSLVTIGQIVGALIFMPLADKFGRKKIYVSLGILTFLSSTLISLSPNYYVYSVMKFVCGALMEGSSMTMYIYIYEMFPHQYRAYVGVFDGFWWACNVVTKSLFGYILQNHSWKILHAATGMVCIINVFAYWLCDESLRWLIVNGKITEARQLINKIAGRNQTTDEKIARIFQILDTHLDNDTVTNIKQEQEQFLDLGNNRKRDKYRTKSEEYDMKMVDHPDKCKKHPFTSTNIRDDTCGNNENPIKVATIVEYTSNQDVKTRTKLSTDANYKSEQQSNNSPASVWTIFKNRYLVGLTLIWMFTWLTDSLTYYSLLLSSVQWEGNRFLNFCISGLLDLPSNILYWIVVRRVSRRKALIGCHLLAGIPLLISAVLLVFKENNPTFGHIAIAFSFLGKIGIGSSHGILYVYTPETFPTNLRNIGFGIAASAARAGGIVAPFSSFVAAHIEWVPSVVFSICCVIVAFLGLLLPETRDLPLPQTICEIEQWKKQTEQNTTEIEVCV